MRELVIDADIAHLDEVIAFVCGELEAGGCDMKAQAQISIAVEEIFVNIAHYAYNPEIGGAVIRVAVDDEVVIEFEDKGKPFNPLGNEEPDITKSAEQREIGGLGIFMVKQIMDSVQYKNLDNKNILIIKKTIVS